MIVGFSTNLLTVLPVSNTSGANVTDLTSRRSGESEVMKDGCGDRIGLY